MAFFHQFLEVSIGVVTSIVTLVASILEVFTSFPERKSIRKSIRKSGSKEWDYPGHLREQVPPWQRATHDRSAFCQISGHSSENFRFVFSNFGWSRELVYDNL